MNITTMIQEEQQHQEEHPPSADALMNDVGITEIINDDDTQKDAAVADDGMTDTTALNKPFRPIREQITLDRVVSSSTNEVVATETTENDNGAAVTASFDTGIVVGGLNSIGIVDDDDDDDDDDDISVTFSTVWEEIVIEPHQPHTERPAIHSSQSPSSHCNTDVPSQGTLHGCRRQSRTGMIEDGRSLDSMIVLYDPQSINHQNTDNSTGKCINDNENDTSDARVIPRVVSIRDRQHRHDDPDVQQNRRQNRVGMMEDSRSLDSTNVMYHSVIYPSRNHHGSTNSNIRNSDENDASDVVVVPNVVAVGGRQQDHQNEQVMQQISSQETRLRSLRRTCYWSLRLMCFPIWLLVSVFTVSTVIAFCILPGILILCIMISFYYCCSRDPIPFNVLMRALLLDDENTNGNAGNTNAPPRTKDEIRELLICRTCTKIQRRRTLKHSNDDTNATSNSIPNTHQPDHEEIVSYGPIYIATENYLVFFSGLNVTANQSLVEDQTRVGRPPSLHLNSVENDNSSSVDAVQVWGTQSYDADRDDHCNDGDDDIDDDDVKVHSNEYSTTRNDIEQGRDGAIEMTAMTSSAVALETEVDSIGRITSVDSTKEVKSTGDQIVQQPALDDGSSPDDDTDYFDSGIGCDICLHRYQENDVVAWSYNAQCVHSYHLHCITDWLQKKITCPNCRCHFIPRNTDSQEHKRNLQRSQAQNDRIVLENDNQEMVTVPTATTRNSTISRSDISGQTGAILQHQESIARINL